MYLNAVLCTMSVLSCILTAQICWTNVNCTSATWLVMKFTIYTGNLLVPRVGASYFRLVRPLGLCVHLSVNNVGGLGACSPRTFFLKFGTLRSLLRPCLGQIATRISPPVVSAARWAIEPSCQKWPLRTMPMLAPPQFARSQVSA